MKCQHCGQEMGPLDALPHAEQMVRNLVDAGYDAQISVVTDRPYEMVWKTVTVRVGKKHYQYAYTANSDAERVEELHKALMLHLLAEGIRQ